MANRLRDNNRNADRCFLMLKKHEHRYVFIWENTKADRDEILRTLGRMACNPEIEFTWYDAATLSARIRAVATNQE